MRLAFKFLFIFIFCSILLYGFNGPFSTDLPLSNQEFTSASKITNSAPNKTAILLANLPKEIKESSGIEEADKPGTYYTHSDANNPAELFKIDRKGNLLATIVLPSAENVDWEDLARDNKGNIYIADTGNNSNKRKKLRIYKLNPHKPDNVQVINFEYADRKNGTADKAHFEFDCEALFWYQNKLHLITKDRSDGVQAKLYQLPDQPGIYEAKLMEKYEVKSPVTAADISPDGKTMLLLSEGKIHLFFPTSPSAFFKGGMKTLNLGQVGQTEAAVFTGNKEIVITSENGQMYRFTL